MPADAGGAPPHKALASALAAAGAATAILRDGVITYLNAAFLREYGDVRGKTIAHFFNAEHVEQLNWLMRGSEADKIVLPLRDQFPDARAGKPLMVQLWPFNNAQVCLLSLTADFSLQRLADMDELTALPNRRKARMLLDIEKARTSRAAPFCLTLADIDHFKAINDTYGHATGDRVLQHAAQMFTAVLRESDWVARWGGEEFLIFIGGSDIITGMQPVERIREQLQNQPFAGPPQIKVTMSFGLVSSENEKDIDALINKADTLLYEAKRNGRNRIEWQNSDQIIWVAENIKKALRQGKVSAASAPLTGWSGAVAAKLITPAADGLDITETQKMMQAAKRLSQQALIDQTLMSSFQRQFPNGCGEATIFLLQRQLYSAHEAEVQAFFSRYPNMLIGIDADDPLPPSMQEALTRLGKPVALLNVDFSKAPSFLLGINALTHIVCKNAYGAGNLAQQLQKRQVQCFLEITAPLTENEIARCRSSGFCGYLKKPAAPAASTTAAAAEKTNQGER